MTGFDAAATAFDVRNAYWLARAARAAYDTPAQINTALVGWGMTGEHYVAGAVAMALPADTQCFVAFDAAKVIVSFRGTESVLDWVSDARIRQVPGPFGAVHSGFDDALEAVWAPLLAAIDRLWTPPRRLWITGHSLGAALATLATARLIAADRPPAGLYTFGSPRAGDPVFEHRFNWSFRTQTFRFVNNQDIVTRVPPRVIKTRHVELYYEHVGTLKYFDSAGAMHDEQNFWLQFLDIVSRSFDDFKAMLQSPVGDHSMEKYVELLRRQAGMPA